VTFYVLADSKKHDNGRLCHGETPQQRQNPGSYRAPTLKIKLSWGFLWIVTIHTTKEAPCGRV